MKASAQVITWKEGEGEEPKPGAYLDNILTGGTSLMMSGGPLYINLRNLNKFHSNFEQILMKLNFLVVVPGSPDCARFASSKY